MKHKLQLSILSIVTAIVLSGCGIFRPYAYKYLKSWNKNAESYKALVDRVENTYWYSESKIAVFDFDGTLFCEKDKTYFDWILAARYVLENADKFSVKDIKLAANVISLGKIPVWESEDSSFVYRIWKDVSLSAYNAAVNKYLDEPMPSFDNLKRRDALFKPMLEVIDYLQANGFKVFVCTGTDRWLVRNVLRGRIPPENIIGSTFGYKAVFTKRNHWAKPPVHTGEIQYKNLKEQKILSIWNEIGASPVLIFGNSSGDYAMADMVYPQDVFMVLCDDIKRDCGDLNEANAVLKECFNHGWIPISMRNDWKTIYGNEVSRKSR